MSGPCSSRSASARCGCGKTASRPGTMTAAAACGQISGAWQVEADHLPLSGVEGPLRTGEPPRRQAAGSGTRARSAAWPRRHRRSIRRIAVKQDLPGVPVSRSPPFPPECQRRRGHGVPPVRVPGYGGEPASPGDRISCGAASAGMQRLGLVPVMRRSQSNTRATAKQAAQSSAGGSPGSVTRDPRHRGE